MKLLTMMLMFSSSLALAACAEGAMDASAMGGLAPFDQGPPGMDIGLDGAALPGDSMGFPDAPSEAGPLPGSEFVPSDAVFPQELLKDVPDYLVPVSAGTKQHVSVSLTKAAWVSVSPRGRELVTWDLFGQSEPKTWDVPSVVNPRQLAVSDTWLVWVDVTFDPEGDLFALNLETGANLLVVGSPRAQRRPAIRGSVLIWEDCRACIVTDERPQPAIYRRVLGGLPAEELLSEPGLSNSRPVHGTLANGAPALAWSVGTANLRVFGDGVDLTFEAQGRGIQGFALQGGQLAFRTQPAIINPDSMIPTDPWLLDVASGEQTIVASDQSLLAQLPTDVVSAGDGFAWLSQSSSALQDVRVDVVSVDGAPVASFSAPPATEIVGGGGWIGLVAPLGANAGDNDVFLKPAP